MVLQIAALFILLAASAEGGARSSAGFDPRKRRVWCPQCGKKVRLRADGWGYCRRCGAEFDGRYAQDVTDDGYHR